MISTKNDIDDALGEGQTLSIDVWYDRSLRSWRTMVVNENGWQVGAAMFDGTRADAAASKRQLESWLEAARSREVSR